MTTRSVAILLGATDPWPGEYYAAHLAQVWRQWGITVHVVRDGAQAPQADLALVHIDLTTVPERILALGASYPRAFNARVADISRRRYSAHTVGPDDGYRGPVIIKSNCNYGGLPEMKARHGRWTGKLLVGLRQRLPWWITRRPGTHNYPILEDAGAVPAWVWADPALLVERFTPEFEDGLYWTRYWLFCGHRDYAVRFGCPTPLVKAGNAVVRQTLDDVPEAVRALRQRLDLDYGKIDYVTHDGHTVILDVNKTNAYRLLEATPSPQAVFLAAGILDPAEPAPA